MGKPTVFAIINLMSAPSDTLEASGSLTSPRHRLIVYSQREGFRDEENISTLSDILALYDTLAWLDISDPQEEDIRTLSDELGIHGLALEETTAKHPRPKCVEYPGFYLLVMNAAGMDENDEVQLREVIAYIGQKFIVTVHRDAFPEIDECIRRWRTNHDVQATSIAAPLYSFLDTVVDGYFPVLDRMAEQVDRVEDHVLDVGAEGPPRQMYILKREFLDLRRVVSAQRDAVNTLLRQDIQLFSEGSVIFFQSVFDHLVRLVESIDIYRDLLSTAADMHLSVVSNRLNQVMKTLTAWSIILMAGSLIAGIYGMNFRYMPELSARNGYFIVLGLIATMGISLAVYFKRIKWM